MTIDLSYPGITPSKQGWGPGWKPPFPPSGGPRPASYPGEIVDLVVGGVAFPGGVRKEIHELLELILKRVEKKGYKLHDGWCWGGAFRATKRSDGTFTTTPSNHSWYLAVDINAPENCFGCSTHAVPMWVVRLFADYGFAWLGDDIKDWMHFQFAGSREDAARMLKKARKNLGPKYTVAGKSFAKVGSALQRARRIIEHGTVKKVTIKVT